MTEKTILVDKYITTSTKEFADDNLPIHALAGLHDVIFDKIKNFLPLGSSLLELASGSGALAKRLYSTGYKVTASDYVHDNFRLHNTIPFVKQDLNEDFSKTFNTMFDCIVAIEIIEHLENPRHFLRECKKLLKPNGFIIFSTPNIDNPVSKSLYLRHGYFQWFSNVNYEVDGHITPITQWMLTKIIDECNFSVINKSSFGNPFNYLSSWPRMKLIAQLIKILSNTDKDMNGEVAIYILEASK